jgi:hypothetical protein
MGLRIPSPIYMGDFEKTSRVQGLILSLMLFRFESSRGYEVVSFLLPLRGSLSFTSPMKRAQGCLLAWPPT